MAIVQLYTLPIIAGDLRRAELVNQYADTFDYLESISQDVYNRIAMRLNVYRAQLNKFDERIQHLNTHIHQIKGSKCAIQVHSSPYYPVEQNRSTYKSIFQHETDNEENKPPVHQYTSFRLNETVDKFFDPNNKESKSNDDTLVVLKQYENNFIQKTKGNVSSSLGKPPANIKSVASFLKYNTQENPYIQSTNIDPLSVGGRMRKRVDEPVQQDISEIPVPASYKQMSQSPAIDNFDYNPISVPVPTFILPDNLPELDHFANFGVNTVIDWTKQQIASIAPTHANEVLPDINDLPSTAPTHANEVLPDINDLPSTAPPNEPPKANPIPVPPLPSPLQPPVSQLPSQDSLVLTLPPRANESKPPADESKSPADESKPPADNQPVIDRSGNPILGQINNFNRGALRPVPKSDPVPKTQTSNSMEENIMMFLSRRRDYINPGSDNEDDEDDGDDEWK